MGAFVPAMASALQRVDAADDAPAAAVSALCKAVSRAATGRADAATLRRPFHVHAVVSGGRCKE